MIRKLHGFDFFLYLHKIFSSSNLKIKEKIETEGVGERIEKGENGKGKEENCVKDLPLVEELFCGFP